MKILDIIVPVLDEEDLIEAFYYEVLKTFDGKNLDLEIHFIFVDDGSKDKTLEKIKDLIFLDKKVFFISFSRNFGKEAAILAGLKKATGDLLVIMDVDMQDPPDLLFEMVKILENEKIDAILTARKDRKGEPIIKSFFSNCFYFVCNLFSNFKLKPGTRDFCMMKKHYKEALLLLNEKKRFLKLIFPFLGFTVKYLEYNNKNRISGTSKWSIYKLIFYAIDGIIGESTIFSIFPFFIMSGCFAIFLAIFFYLLFQYFYFHTINQILILFEIFIFLFGMNFFILGIFGQYINRIFIEVRNRPHFIIKEEN